MSRAISLSLLVAAAPLASATGSAGLERLIVERNVRSIEDLLPLLPGDLRSHYALMFRSRSLHGSSFAHPRAILFDPEARFVVSFNGDASQAGFNALETMEFDDVNKSFEFREFVFPPEQDRQASVHVSQPNPESCLKCHGEPPRPIWDTHPTWPGAYGERYGTSLTAAEKSGLSEFLREQPTHPRYRYLLSVDRFANPETFRPSARTRYEGSELPPPNAELGAALGRLNFQAIVHQLESRPEFDSTKYLLLAALGTSCGRLEEFFPADQRAGIQAALDRFSSESAYADAAQTRLKQLRAVNADHSKVGGYERADGIESLDRFRFVVESRLGLSTSQWTTALEKGSYDFAWSPSAASEMESYLRKQVLTDPDTKALAEFRSFAGRDPYCSYLARTSRTALAAGQPSLATATRRAPDTAAASGAARTQALIDKCSGCHLSGVGPHLPFDHPPELTALLREGQFAHGTLMEEIRWRLAPEAGAGRMPLGTNISDADRDALLDYFRGMLRRTATQ